MPGIDGLATLKLIKKLDPNAYVVMVTGAGTITNVKLALSLGAKGFIVKPFSQSKIEEAVVNFRAIGQFKDS